MLINRVIKAREKSIVKHLSFADKIVRIWVEEGQMRAEYIYKGIHKIAAFSIQAPSAWKKNRVY